MKKENELVNIAIKIDKKLHKKLKQRVLDLDTSIKWYLIDLIEADIKQSKESE